MKRIISKQLAVVFVGSNCECITSGSQFWEGAGAITLIIGITVIGAGVRLARKHRTKG